ncbi:hypothetical protein [Agrococcus baldri]|uniref:hypothetical protein n=1 Tax=Agrococcus baldri TaxID=153730 RepID=UPI0011BDA403|nr:hypothetical protein [Agrococcus baldri]
MVIDPDAPSAGVSWQGSYDEQIAASEPRAGFEPAPLLDSDGVLCSVVFRMPLHGPGSEGRVGLASTALVRDDGLRDGVVAWALEHGYEPLEEGEETEFVLEDGDTFDARMSVMAIGEPVYGDVPLESLERRSGLELEPTDVLLTHVDFRSAG